MKIISLFFEIVQCRAYDNFFGRHLLFHPKCHVHRFHPLLLPYLFSFRWTWQWCFNRIVCFPEISLLRMKASKGKGPVKKDKKEVLKPVEDV